MVELGKKWEASEVEKKKKKDGKPYAK